MKDNPLKITSVLIISLLNLLLSNFVNAQGGGNSDSTVVTFAVSPEGSFPRYVYAGTTYGVLRSSNYGDLWEHKNEGLSSPTIVMSIVFHPTSGKIFAGTYPTKGVFYSTNNGDSWIQCGNNGLTNKRIWYILIPFDSSNYILAATAGGGIFRSSDEGNSWVSVNQGLPDMEVFALIQIPNGYIFAATHNHGVYKSSDYGANWVSSNSGLTDYVHDFEYSNGYFYALTDLSGVFRSTNNGNSWTQTDPSAFYSGYAMVAYNNNVITGDFSNPVVHKSTNNGISWLQFNQGLPANLRTRGLEIVNTAGLPQFIFLGSWGFGIFRSSDEGNSWVEKNNGITIPVELINFTANSSGGDIIINWSTATETNNKGFEIQKSVRSSQSAVSNWEAIGFVNGRGTTTEKQNYSFTDNNVSAGKYFYRLKQIDFDGTFEYSNEIEVEIIQPAEFALFQNYPNPFNPSTKISWQSAVSSWQTLKVFDVLGNEIATLVDEYKPAGKYEVEFSTSTFRNGAGLASGIYTYTLMTGDFVQSKKMIILK